MTNDMSEQQVIERPSGPEVDEAQRLKLDRRASRRAGLFAPELLKVAFKQSFIMLRPDIQWKNPVMFVVEIGTVLTLLFTIEAARQLGWVEKVQYLVTLDVWLF